MDNPVITPNAAQEAPSAQTAVPSPYQPSPYPPGPHSASLDKRRRAGRRKKVVKGIIVTLVVLVILGGLAGLSYAVFFMPAPEYYRTGFVTLRDHIYTEVMGGGYLTPAKSETISLTQPGTVLESYAWQGMMVEEDQILAVIDSSAIDKEIEALGKIIDGYQKTINDTLAKIEKVQEDLTEANAEQIAMAKAANVTAPFTGRIIDAPRKTLGEEIKIGEPLGRLVDDKNMKLVLYFSYGYENEIYIGQKCQVSIPSSMSVETGTVTGIEPVRRIASDGTVTFEVEISLKNPGALTSGLPVTASMTAKNGETILPAESGVLEYAQELILTAESKGPLKVWNGKIPLCLRRGASQRRGS